MVIYRNIIICLIFFALLLGCSQKSSNSEQVVKSGNHFENESSYVQNMKIGIILETKEPEKAWNAFRFAVTAIGQGHEVKVFLMGEAVECEGLINEKYDVDSQLKAFVENGGEILACGTCLKSRQIEGSEVCPVSTMVDCVKMVEWADKVITF